MKTENIYVVKQKPPITKVKELIDRLQGYDPEMDVKIVQLLQEDYFSPKVYETFSIEECDECEGIENEKNYVGIVF